MQGEYLRIYFIPTFLFYKFLNYSLSSGCDFSSEILYDLVYLMLTISSKYDAFVQSGSILRYQMILYPKFRENILKKIKDLIERK